MEAFTATNFEAGQFVDPFAEAGERIIDQNALHVELTERYANREIGHDYTADAFVKDTEAAMMTAHFNEQFQQMQSIMQRMEQLCNHDHDLAGAMDGSEALSDFMSAFRKEDDHDHTGRAHNRGKKTKEKKKIKKKTTLSLYEIMMALRKARATRK